MVLTGVPTEKQWLGLARPPTEEQGLESAMLPTGNQKLMLTVPLTRDQGTEVGHYTKA